MANHKKSSRSAPLPAQRPSRSRARLRDHLLRHVGQVITNDTLGKVAGKHRWVQCVRELRDEEGFDILEHHDHADLKPGECMLLSSEPKPAFALDVSEATRACALAKKDFVCQMCGAAAGDNDPYARGRKVRLHLSHFVEKSQGGSDDAGNLRAVCSVCHEGISACTLQQPELQTLQTQVRRASGAVQLELLRWLTTRFVASPSAR